MTPLATALPEPQQTPQRGPRLWRKCLAWAVHGYTALGLVAAACIAVLIVRGAASDFVWAFVLMVTATVIDSTDGMLARAVRVKEVLPGFDGRRLDDVVDFLTFAFLPLLLLWQADVLPQQLAWCWLLPLLASAYGFCQAEAKTADGYFLGFPSLWNVVAFYLYLLRLPAGLVIGITWLLAVLTFIPSRYLYPSRGGGGWNFMANLLGVLWTGVVVWILVRLLADESTDGLTRWLTVLSLAYPAYYMAASWLLTVKFWRARRRVVVDDQRPK